MQKASLKRPAGPGRKMSLEEILAYKESFPSADEWKPIRERDSLRFSPGLTITGECDAQTFAVGTARLERTYFSSRCPCTVVQACRRISSSRLRTDVCMGRQARALLRDYRCGSDVGKLAH